MYYLSFFYFFFVEPWNFIHTICGLQPSYFFIFFYISFDIFWYVIYIFWYFFWYIFLKMHLSNSRIRWLRKYPRVKRKREKCNPFFLAAEGSSAYPENLGATWRSTAEPRESRGEAVSRTWGLLTNYVNTLESNVNERSVISFFSCRRQQRLPREPGGNMAERSGAKRIPWWSSVENLEAREYLSS